MTDNELLEKYHGIEVPNNPDDFENFLAESAGKRIYEIEMYDVPIETNIQAWNMYEGFTADGDIPHDDSPNYWFFSEKDAVDFLNSQYNDYYYNGHGYGWAKEWWLSQSEISEDGVLYRKKMYYRTTKNSNLADFLKEWGDDEEMEGNENDD